MAYNPTIWINDDGTGTVGTPVIANYMNNIEQGIVNNYAQINDCLNRIRTVRLYGANDTLTTTNTIFTLSQSIEKATRITIHFGLTGSMLNYQLESWYWQDYLKGQIYCLPVIHPLINNGNVFFVYI